MEYQEYPDNQQDQQANQQSDISSYPLPIRIKHPSWAARKGTYEQLLYYLKTIESPQEEIIVSGTAYTIETLLPYFENLIQEKHASVLLKGLQCVEQILILDKKAYSKHCIRSLVDKGIQFFPLLSQQRKAILEKFLDILELSKIQSSFLKNKLNLPHQKSVMYVIEVIGVLNMTSLKSSLTNITKKHQKKCVRQLAAEIAEELQETGTDPNADLKNQPQTKNTGPKFATNQLSSKTKTSNPTCKYTIQKLPHYEQLQSKKQQEFSSELAQKIDSIIEEYTFAQLPNFSHILRLMIDDNNHIINVNAIKCLIAIFDKQKDEGLVKNSLIPVSFPLLFLFNKFKSHKTHPINFLMLNLIESILQSSPNRVNDLFLAINEGLSSAGSKANVKFGCALAFFRIVSLLYKSQDLYKCTVNENMENQNEDITQKMSHFESVKLNKNMMKVMEKVLITLDKDKKYDTEMYLIKHGIELDSNNLQAGTIGNNLGSSKDILKTKISKSQNQSKSKFSSEASKTKKNDDPQTVNKPNKKSDNLESNSMGKKSVVSNNLEAKLTKTLKEAPKFEQINLEETLNKILRLVNTPPEKQKPSLMKQMKSMLERSEQEFWQCVKERRFEMFYLCELLEYFIETYQPDDNTIQRISEYLISLLKIVSLMKPINTSVKEISLNNVSQLLLVALCKLVISEEIHEVLENLNQNYGFQIIFQALEEVFVRDSGKNKIKKKNKKHLLQWLQSNTPALHLNRDFDRLIETINEKQVKKNKHQGNPEIIERVTHEKQVKILQKSPISSHAQHQSPKRVNQKQPTQRASSDKNNPFSYSNLNELQNINLSKIQQNAAQSNEYYDEDMEKSSFHQNIEEHLRHIKTNRDEEDYEEGTMHNNFMKSDNQTSREYLKYLKKEQKEEENPYKHPFMKKNPEQNHMKILETSPFKSEKSQPEQSHQIQHQECQKGHQQEDYAEKVSEVEKRRIERERERRQFMNRMKNQFKPAFGVKVQSDQSEPGSSEENSQYLEKKSENRQTQRDQHSILKDKFRLRENLYQENSEDNNPKQPESQVSHHQNLVLENQSLKPLQRHVQNVLPNTTTTTTTSGPQKSQIQEPKQQQPDCSFISSTSSGQFKYREINHQKLSYMLKSTSNPYQHLRNLILIPFKSSHKKHHFLKELLHYLTNHVELKMPQPYTSLILLIILMFSEIKEDKTLIQPLQSLYEFMAKQSTTNDFIKTIVNLFHTVIEETLPQNRKFLITILLKSMIRLLPFIQDGLSLLRDIQQFYQIGQMVYFEMFEEEYTQIKTYIEEEAVHIVVEKAFEQEGHNLNSIVEGWLGTQWKSKVLETMEEFESVIQQQDHENQDYQRQNYQSYI